MRRTQRCPCGIARELGIKCPTCDRKELLAKDNAELARHRIQSTDYAQRVQASGGELSKHRGSRKRSSEAARKKAAKQVGRANPNLISKPIPAEFAEPAPKRTGTR